MLSHIIPHHTCPCSSIALPNTIRLSPHQHHLPLLTTTSPSSTPQSLSALDHLEKDAHDAGRTSTLDQLQRQEAELRLQLAKWCAATGQGSQDDLQRM